LIDNDLPVNMIEHPSFQAIAPAILKEKQCTIYGKIGISRETPGTDNAENVRSNDEGRNMTSLSPRQLGLNARLYAEPGLALHYM